MSSPGTTIIIKALNEEANIARGIESALRAVDVCGGEVVLADSASTDRTVEVAKRYPIRIARLTNPAERCCGVGPQLGFEASRCDFIYILDGDMEMDAMFLPKALAYLAREPQVAGVGGYVEEMRIANVEFESRVKRQLRSLSDKPKAVDCLGGGGVYRRPALEAVGYMSDRNLHAFEEYDLGARLRSRGWRLVRLPDQAARHWSYDLSSMKMLWHRLRSGSFMSLGEVLRASLAAGYAGKLMSEMRLAQLAVGVWTYWIAAIVLVGVTGSGLLGLLAVAAPFVGMLLMGWKHRALAVGVLSIASWHISALGLLLGALKRRTPPMTPIGATIVQEGSVRAPATSSSV